MTTGATPADRSSTVEAADRLIVALDVPSAEEARSIVADLQGTVRFYKIGLHLQLIRGTEQLITDVVEAGNRLFLDYKIADIGASMKANIRAAANRGISFVTMQGSGDLSAELVGAAIEGKLDGWPQIFCVTLLTGLDDADAQRLYGKSVSEIVVERAALARGWGCDGVIASGLEVGLIKEQVSTAFQVITPGIRPTGTGANDQRRVASPSEAIGRGSDYLVVGRPILAEPDGKAAAQRILAEMQIAFDARG